MNTKNLNITFYQNIAKIFYAVAKADNIVAPEELKVLKKVVKENWLQVDETFDVFGTDTVYQIEIVFDWLFSKNATSEDCFNDFVEYYQNHSYFFTTDIKALIIETSGKIASSFAQKNKSELVVLAKLNVEFNKEIA